MEKCVKTEYLKEDKLTIYIFLIQLLMLIQFIFILSQFRL